jgi:hypothetical protein
MRSIIVMKNHSLFVVVCVMGLFSIGCEPAPVVKPTGKPATTDTGSDHMTADSGEEKPAAPAAGPKPEGKPESESNPEAPAGEAKPEEKPSDAPKS